MCLVQGPCGYRAEGNMQTHTSCLATPTASLQLGELAFAAWTEALGQQGRVAPQLDNVFLLMHYLLQALGLSGKESWLQMATKVAATVLRQKVISSDKDEVAVIFYNTVRSARDLCNVLKHLNTEKGQLTSEE